MIHMNHFYEISLQIRDPKIEFSTKTHFLKMTMSKILEILFVTEKSPSGVVPKQNKGCKHIPDHSPPNTDQIISQNSYFYNNFIEHRGFSIKIAKKFKIVAKALLRAEPSLSANSICGALAPRSCCLRCTDASMTLAT